ncbi:hypothetical protein J3D46_004872 [Paenarthrobacter sp. A20]|nr:hypothetical protein [Paenarthrobacter sp. A20]
MLLRSYSVIAGAPGPATGKPSTCGVRAQAVILPLTLETCAEPRIRPGRISLCSGSVKVIDSYAGRSTALRKGLPRVPAGE